MNRREILYLYDASYCNPNGDPADENKPRTDPETQINLVSDVRLKRTIRDYLREVKGKEIFVTAVGNENDVIPTAKERALNFLKEKPEKGENLAQVKVRMDKTIINDCIDIRLFGATIPLEISILNDKGKSKKEKGSIIHTGPVQFKMGKSLHMVSVERIKGNGAFASSENATQTTFRTEYMVPYSLISFHGIVNEYRAEEVELSEEDIKLLFEAMWDGTKFLVTRSKIGQTPRFLMSIVYKSGNFQISDLDNKVNVKSDKDDLALRSVSDYELDVNSLMTSLIKHKSKIEKIELAVDENFRVFYNGKTYVGDEVREIFKDFSVDNLWV